MRRDQTRKKTVIQDVGVRVADGQPPKSSDTESKVTIKNILRPEYRAYETGAWDCWNYCMIRP